jgi:hypothetical protein
MQKERLKNHQLFRELLTLRAAIIFRIRSFKDFSGSDLERLPSICMGEVKCCTKLPADGTSAAYEVGIKYYPQVY